MAKFINVCALLAACCMFMSIHYAAAAPPISKLTVRIYHGESERFVRGTKLPEILMANGGDPDPFTVFYPHQRPGNRTAFESVNYSGEYLVMNGDGTLSLSSPKGKIYEFTNTPAGKSSRYRYLFATVPSGATCYISFDVNGAPLANQCNTLTAVGRENAKVQVS